MLKTQQLLKVAVVLLADPDGRHHGYGIAKATNLQSGTVYPMLQRLQKAGWLEGEWDPPGSGYGAPSRHSYKLTDKGIVELRKIVDSARRAQA